MAPWSWRCCCGAVVAARLSLKICVSRSDQTTRLFLSFSSAITSTIRPFDGAHTGVASRAGGSRSAGTRAHWLAIHTSFFSFFSLFVLFCHSRRFTAAAAHDPAGLRRPAEPQRWPAAHLPSGGTAAHDHLRMHRFRPVALEWQRQCIVGAPRDCQLGRLSMARWELLPQPCCTGAGPAAAAGGGCHG